ncbi:MAG: hypothetical protein V8Q79_05885 [Christensenellales bacterium]
MRGRMLAAMGGRTFKLTIDEVMDQQALLHRFAHRLLQPRLYRRGQAQRV